MILLLLHPTWRRVAIPLPQRGRPTKPAEVFE